MFMLYSIVITADRICLCATCLNANATRPHAKEVLSLLYPVIVSECLTRSYYSCFLSNGKNFANNPSNINLLDRHSVITVPLNERCAFLLTISL